MASLVSVLIPAHDAEPYLAETIESVLGQTWPEVELIVAENGSKDRTLEIARRYESPRIRVHTMGATTASAARNRAMREARGDYLQYLDADDLLETDKIEKQVRALETRGEVDIVASGPYARFFGDLRNKLEVPAPATSKSQPGIEQLLASWNRGGMLPICNWLIPRSVAERAGEWNERLTVNDDGEYVSRVLLASKGVEFVPGAYSYYRSNVSGSLSGARTDEALRSQFESIERSVSHVLAAERSERTLRACANWWQEYVFATFPLAPELVRRAEQRVRDLGGSDFEYKGGPAFRAFAHAVGWKNARRLQLAMQKLRSGGALRG